MSLFYIARHAEAEPNHAAGDRTRPITTRGREGFKTLLETLAPRMNVVRIRHSPFTRATETAQIAADILEVEMEVDDALVAGALSGIEFLRHVRRYPEGTLVVGHNPEVAGALAFATNKAPQVMPGAVGCIDAEGNEVVLEWLEAPR